MRVLIIVLQWLRQLFRRYAIKLFLFVLASAQSSYCIILIKRVTCLAEADIQAGPDLHSLFLLVLFVKHVIGVELRG